MQDIRQTPKYAKYLRAIGWNTIEKRGVYYFLKKIPLAGFVVKIQRPEIVDLETIKQISQKQRIFQIIIEPKDEMGAKHLKAFGFKRSKNPYLPTKTLVLDLTQSKKGLVSQFKKDARQALKKTKNLKVDEIKIKDLESFRSVWKKSVSPKRFIPPLSDLKALKKIFKNDCLLLSCIDTSKQEIVAGAIFLKTKKSAYYWQAFTNKKGRRLLAQYRLVWKGIVWAKERGAKIFDFEGIYDERFPNKSWRGFSHFKKSFGGHEVKYPGAFTKLLPKITLQK